MTYCQVCDKHYRVINSSHLFSKNHLKQMRHIESAIKHYKQVIEYNQQGINYYQGILDEEIKKLEKAKILFNAVS